MLFFVSIDPGRVLLSESGGVCVCGVRDSRVCVSAHVNQSVHLHTRGNVRLKRWYVYMCVCVCMYICGGLWSTKDLISRLKTPLRELGSICGVHNNNIPCWICIPMNIHKTTPLS